MPGLENTRVATRTRRVPGTDLLKELVRRFALLNVAAGQPARVKRARSGLRNELLDEWAQLLRLRLRRHDRFVLDQRRCQVAHERKFLLARAPKLPSCLPVTHSNY